MTNYQDDNSCHGGDIIVAVAVIVVFIYRQICQPLSPKRENPQILGSHHAAQNKREKIGQRKIKAEGQKMSAADSVIDRS